MSFCTKKVACVAVPLFCLHLTAAAETAVSDLGMQSAAVEETTSVSQSVRKVTGVVKDESGEPVAGASVVEVGTTNGIMTDLDGRFTLTVGSGASL